MAKTANINVRIDPETKASAEQLFSSFGITVTDAINIFLHKSLMEGGLPFEMKQPRFNLETENGDGGSKAHYGRKNSRQALCLGKRIIG